MSANIAPGKIAIVLIDLQKGVLAMPLAPYGTAQLLEKCLALAKAVKAAGGLIVAINAHFGPDGILAPHGEVDAPISAGSDPDYAELNADLLSLEPDICITKRSWGAFHGTELDTQLRRRGVETIVLCGVATNFGVETTAREAWQHNYSLLIAEDATTSFSAEMHRFPVEVIFPRLSRVRTVAEIIQMISVRSR